MADDTTTIQKLLNAGGDVKLPGGQFVVAPLKSPASLLSVEGGPVENPTTLILAPGSPDGARIFYPQHTGGADRTIAFRNLRFDMNRSAMGWDGAWSHAHQAAIFLTADRLTSGRLIAEIENVEIRNSAGDGIYVDRKTTANIRGVRMAGVWRAGLAMNGHQSITDARHCRFSDCGPEVEPNDAKYVIQATLHDIECYDFDMALKAGCKVRATDIRGTGGMVYLHCHPTAEFYCADFDFLANPDGRIEIAAAGQSTFQRGVFRGYAGLKSNIVNIAWDGKKNQNLTFREVTTMGPSPLGVFVSEDIPANANQFSYIDGKIVGTDAGAEAPKTNSGRQKRGLPWILTNSFGPDGQPLK